MADWNRTPLKGMSREELERRMADGIRNWKAKGWIPKDFGEKKPKPIAQPGEKTLSKAGQARCIEAANLAIYALANGDRADYVGAVRVMLATVRLEGLPNASRFLQIMCDGIADAASEASGEPRYMLDQIARSWLADDMKTGQKLVSIPSKGANDDGEEEKGSEPGEPGRSGDLDKQAPGAGEESEFLPREERGGAGGEGGSVGADPAGAGGSGPADPDQDGPGQPAAV